VLKVENGLITEEIGLDDGVTALKMLGLISQNSQAPEHAATRGLGTVGLRPWP
jgi:hypothetical protein